MSNVNFNVSLASAVPMPSQPSLTCVEAGGTCYDNSENDCDVLLVDLNGGGYDCIAPEVCCAPSPPSLSLCEIYDGVCTSQSICNEILGGQILGPMDCPFPQYCCRVPEDPTICSQISCQEDDDCSGINDQGNFFECGECDLSDPPIASVIGSLSYGHCNPHPIGGGGIACIDINGGTCLLSWECADQGGINTGQMDCPQVGDVNEFCCVIPEAPPLPNPNPPVAAISYGSHSIPLFSSIGASIGVLVSLILILKKK